jgi:hypothetical protein
MDLEKNIVRLATATITASLLVEATLAKPTHNLHSHKESEPPIYTATFNQSVYKIGQITPTQQGVIKIGFPTTGVVIILE